MDKQRRYRPVLRHPIKIDLPDLEHLDTADPRVFIGCIFVVSVALLVTLILSLFGLGIVLFPAILAGYWESWRDKIAASWLLQVLVVMGAISCALYFYVMRSEQRGIYAVVECVAGVMICWATTLSRSSGGMTVALAMASGMYVLVRGFDNAEQYLKEKRRAARKSAKKDRSAMRRNKCGNVFDTNQCALGRISAASNDFVPSSLTRDGGNQPSADVR